MVECEEGPQKLSTELSTGPENSPGLWITFGLAVDKLSTGLSTAVVDKVIHRIIHRRIVIFYNYYKNIINIKK